MSILYSKDNSIYELDLLTNLTTEVISFESRVVRFLFTNDNSRVLVNFSESLRLYDVNSKELLHSFKINYEYITSFAINKNETKIAILYRFNECCQKIHIFDLSTYEIICYYNDLNPDDNYSHQCHSYKFEFNNDGSILFIFVHNEIVIFDVDNNVVLNRKSIKSTEIFSFLEFKIYDDEIFIIMRENDKLKVLNGEFNVISEFPHIFTGIYIFNPVDKKFIISPQFSIKEYDIITGEYRDVIQNLYGIHSNFFSTDGSTLAVNCLTKILIFDVNNNYSLIRDVSIKLTYISYPRFKITGYGSYI